MSDANDRGADHLLSERLAAGRRPVIGVSDDAELLRFSTAGSVDDGKSTLIGRLLYDTKTVFEDQVRHVEDVSRRRGDERVNLALLTDGLRAEREQGITIDVAYRYFATPRRKFIIADTPGHVQYTRNMVTGASTADMALILVDARKGIIEQSRRHAFLASLLGVPHLVLCINKMDLVDYDQEVFEEMVRYRTVGDATCTAAVASMAIAIEDVIAEVAASRITERGATRADDKFSEAAMEDRKREGYF